VSDFVRCGFCIIIVLLDAVFFLGTILLLMLPLFCFGGYDC
jgi:hypothetical protein